MGATVGPTAVKSTTVRTATGETTPSVEAATAGTTMKTSASTSVSTTATMSTTAVLGKRRSRQANQCEGSDTCEKSVPQGGLPHVSVLHPTMGRLPGGNR
jgi:hypothetical protein